MPKAFVRPKWLDDVIARSEKFEYVKCPECGLEWSKLRSEVCYDCDEKRFEKAKQQKRMEEKFQKIFGSVKAMNYYTFEKFKPRQGTGDAFEACREFDSKKHNIYLHGGVGSGKTHLAYATAKMFALNGKAVVVATPLKIVDSFRTKNDLEKEDKFREFVDADVLLIDDLGISKHTDFAIEVLCEVMNRRALQMRNGLIVTSNLSLDKLTDKNKDDRLTSRLAGLCQVIEVTAPDYRLNFRR